MLLLFDWRTCDLIVSVYVVRGARVTYGVVEAASMAVRLAAEACTYRTVFTIDIDERSNNSRDHLKFMWTTTPIDICARTGTSNVQYFSLGGNRQQ